MPRSTPRRPVAPVDPLRMKLMEEFVSRTMMSAALGQSFGGKRDLYVSCGYKKDLSIQDYADLYARGDIAKTIVNAYPDACWEGEPVLREEKPASRRNIAEASTPFEKAWEELADEVDVARAFLEADRLSGVGRYGILLVGTDDGQPLDTPLKRAGAVTYLRPFGEAALKVDSWETDTRSPRYGRPTAYQVQVSGVDDLMGTGSQAPGDSSSFRVHYTRAVHLAEGLEDSLVFGTPRLKGIWNRVTDAHKVLGGSAEMFWLGAFGPTIFNASPDGEMEDIEQIQDRVQKMVHGLQRYFFGQGIDVKQLSPSVVDPRNHILIQLQFISAFTGIPMRILLGSERGELASTQDERAWQRRVAQRRTRYCHPYIIRPFVRLVVDAGIVPSPKAGPAKFWTEWSEADTMDAQAMATVGASRTTAMSAYLQGGVDQMVGPEEFLVRVLGFEPWEAEEMVGSALRDLEQELADAKASEEEAAAAKQEADLERAKNPPAPTKEAGTSNRPFAPAENEFDPNQARDERGQWSTEGGLGRAGGLDVGPSFKRVQVGTRPVEVTRKERDPQGNVTREWKEAEHRPVYEFRRATGEPAPAADVQERINKLQRVLSPKYTEVYVNPDPAARLQAVAREAESGKWQPVYSAAHIHEHDAQKFARIREFAHDINEARKVAARDLKAGVPEAVAFRVEDLTTIRVGSRDEGTSYGLTTLENRHVTVNGDQVRFQFTGKAGVEWDRTIQDRQVARWVANRQSEDPAPEAKVFRTNAKAFNDYVGRAFGGKEYTAKDFRTYHATRVASEVVQRGWSEGLSKRDVSTLMKDAVSAAANYIGDTPGMAKAKYIDPVVWDRMRPPAK